MPTRNQSINDAPNVGSMNEFLSQVHRYGEFAKVARFIVQIGRINDFSSPPLAQRDLTLMCETAEIPGRAFETYDYRYYGPSFKLPHMSAYNDLDLTFFVADDMAQKQFFDDWISKINPKNTYDFSFLDEYSTDIAIWQYSSFSRDAGNKHPNARPVASYKATFRRAYPINVFPMPSTWAEDNFHRLRVTFTYTDWINLPEKNAQTG